MTEKIESKTLPEPSPGPLFIVSMWRGGSSSLYALLNKHAQVALMFEADLLQESNEAAKSVEFSKLPDIKS